LQDEVKRTVGTIILWQASGRAGEAGGVGAGGKTDSGEVSRVAWMAPMLTGDPSRNTYDQLLPLSLVSASSPLPRPLFSIQIVRPGGGDGPG